MLNTNSRTRYVYELYYYILTNSTGLCFVIINVQHNKGQNSILKSDRELCRHRGLFSYKLYRLSFDCEVYLHKQCDNTISARVIYYYLLLDGAVRNGHNRLF